MQSKQQPDIQFMLSDSSHVLALGFGSGLAVKAPGTWGTLAAIPLWLLISMLGFCAQLGVVVVAFILGIAVCDRTTKNLGVHDHGSIVWDEFVGFWLTMLFLPAGYISIFIGFVLFRLFDIVKPWPIRAADRHVHGGFGIMLDDIIAAIFAGASYQLVVFIVGLF
jgi:phosphatidylglycerophosphatase A